MTFSQGSYFKPIKPEDNTMHELQQTSWTMRQEFEGVGKEGTTEVRVKAMAARGRREGIPVCRFFSRVLIPPPPFTTRWNACYTGYNSGVSNSKTLALRGATIGYSKTGRVRKRTQWTREQERTGTLSSLPSRAPLTYWRALIPPLLPFKCLTQATNQGGEQTKLNTTWCN